MAQQPDYPPNDPAKADLLVCPFTGKPILRLKPGVTPDQLSAYGLDLAAETKLGRDGAENVVVWTAKESP